VKKPSLDSGQNPLRFGIVLGRRWKIRGMLGKCKPEKNRTLRVVAVVTGQY
jgi:hypothetical protein